MLRFGAYVLQERVLKKKGNSGSKLVILVIVGAKELDNDRPLSMMQVG
jgi:hypothetical protein